MANRNRKRNKKANYFNGNNNSESKPVKKVLITFATIVSPIVALIISTIALIVGILAMQYAKQANIYTVMTSPLNFHFSDKITNIRENKDVNYHSNANGAAINIKVQQVIEGYDGYKVSFWKDDSVLCGNLYEVYISCRSEGILDTARFCSDEQPFTEKSLHQGELVTKVDKLLDDQYELDVYQKQSNKKEPLILYLTFKGYSDNIKQFILLIDEKNPNLPHNYTLIDARDLTNISSISTTLLYSIACSDLYIEYGLEDIDASTQEITTISVKDLNTVQRAIRADLDNILTFT